MTVRVRFAPSPTGPLHIGGVRTALFNYLFAKKHNGTFILRIEDTDQSRYVEGAEDYIVESLEWCGIEIDEGYTKGGAKGPYKQSDRKDIYHEYAEQLIKNGMAYYAFDTPEAIAERRNAYESEGKTFTYNQEERKRMSNSLTLSEDIVKQKIETGEPYVIRFKMPEDRIVEMHDIVRGDMKVNTNTLDDKVLFKSDGLPTYHLANIVDDHLMEISHVIRGEEWLPSLALHYLLYEALGWQANQPQFAHLPLLLKPTGKGKLSKRDGEKMGFPVFPLKWQDKAGGVAAGYREDGYFPEAFINMLALLGWNPGTEQEILSKTELIELFDLNKVQKAGARFDPEKAKWFNHQYLQNKPVAEITKAFSKILDEKSISCDLNILEEIVSMVRERVNFVHELWDQTYFFFQNPESYDAKVVKKRWKNDVPQAIANIQNILAKADKWQADDLKQKVSDYINKNDLGFGAVMNGLRLSIVGGAKGPDLFKIIETIGRDRTLERIDLALEKLGN